VNLPAESDVRSQELSSGAIISIVDQARRMGCRHWFLSGGEPMLRADFSDILEYITDRSSSYTLNTNGTLITPKIARLLRRKGSKMVALYGADAEVHDHITRVPGSFEAFMRGIRYLKEAGAHFTVQIIPMKDNFHQYHDMIRLAESLSSYWRIGAAWLFLSPEGDTERNREIKRQRLSSDIVVELDKPDLVQEEAALSERSVGQTFLSATEGLYAACISNRRSFYVNPYGRMTFCEFVRDPDLMYDLRGGSIAEGWEQFIPSLSCKIKADDEYLENCGDCQLTVDCRWCPVYGYLEHGRHTARVQYLCEIARENKMFKDNYRRNHRRYYQIAGLKIQLESDLPIKADTFHAKFRGFESSEGDGDKIIIRHHFGIPVHEELLPEEVVYDKPPWIIYRRNNSWIYVIGSSSDGGRSPSQVARFNYDHTRAEIFNSESLKERFIQGDVKSLTMFPTDQVLLARLLANREGCYLHSSGVIIDGKGLAFVGHSGAGKTTIAEILKGCAEILSDDRIIIRKLNDGVRIFGTWSHGDLPDVSCASAPTQAIMFLRKSGMNRIERIDDRFISVRNILDCVIKPFVTGDWWDNILQLIHEIALSVPVFNLYFDGSSKVKATLEEFLEQTG